MKKQDILIDKAAEYLKGKGYLISSTKRIKGVDLIVFGSDRDKPIFVTVGDSSKVRSIPLNGFGYSKKAKERAARFIQGAKNWMDAYCFDVRPEYDAVWVSTFDGSISHLINIQMGY